MSDRFDIGPEFRLYDVEEVKECDMWAMLQDADNGGDTFYVSDGDHVNFACAHDEGTYLVVATSEYEEEAEDIRDLLQSTGYENARVWDTFDRFDEPWSVCIEVEG